MAGIAAKKAVERSNGKSTNGHNAVTAPAAIEILNTNGNGHGKDLCRTTAVFPAVLNVNWELYALQKGIPKNEVLIEALRAFLIAKNFEPDKMPKFNVSWHD